MAGPLTSCWETWKEFSQLTELRLLLPAKIVEEEKQKQKPKKMAIFINNLIIIFCCLEVKTFKFQAILKDSTLISVVLPSLVHFVGSGSCLPVLVSTCQTQTLSWPTGSLSISACPHCVIWAHLSFSTSQASIKEPRGQNQAHPYHYVQLLLLFQTMLNDFSCRTTSP